MIKDIIMEIIFPFSCFVEDDFVTEDLTIKKQYLFLLSFFFDVTIATYLYTAVLSWFGHIDPFLLYDTLFLGIVFFAVIQFLILLLKDKKQKLFKSEKQ